MSDLTTAEKIDQLQAQEVYSKLEAADCNVSLLKECEAEIKTVMAKAVFDVGRALIKARQAFPAQANNTKGDDSWDYWITNRIGCTKRAANQYIKVTQTFGSLGNAFPTELSFRVLNELTGAKYSPLVRDTALALAADNEKLSTKDCTILNTIALAHKPMSVNELKELYQQVESGYVKAADDPRVSVAVDTFKASNAIASNVASVAQQYRENREFAPPKVVAKVENDMIHAVNAWIEALPVDRLYDIKHTIEQRLQRANGHAPELLTIEAVSTDDF